MVFQCINIHQVPWEMLKTAAFGHGFQHLPRDLANVNAWKTMFDPYIEFDFQHHKTIYCIHSLWEGYPDKCFCCDRFIIGIVIIISVCVSLCIYITKTYLYNFDPLKPHFYIVKLGFTGVYIIFLFSTQKHRLWVLVRTVSSRQF